jgi:hypothetical protein
MTHTHIVVKAMKCDKQAQFLKAVLRNTEKFLTIQLNNYHLLDSMSILGRSLANVVEDLTCSKHPFKLLHLGGIYTSSKQKLLLLQKGVYPY